MSTGKSDSGTSSADFGAKLKELEAVTAWFESGEVDLSAALTKFERGMQLADELKQELQKIENRVEKIKAKFETSAPAAAYTDADTAPEELLDGDGPTLF